MARSEPLGDAAGQPALRARRVAMAREVLDLLRRALPAHNGLELVFADDVGGSVAPGAARIVIDGPDALARLLWPPTPDSLGEAYLRGDLDWSCRARSGDWRAR